MNEDKIKTELENKFDFLKDKITVKRERRIFTDYLALDDFLKAFDFAVKNLDFKILCTITGIEEENYFGAIYHVAKEDGTTLSLKALTPKDNPRLKTITEYFPAADIYEREILDLFGIKIEGLKEGLRYPMPDEFPKDQHPLRKSWKQ